MAERAPRSWGLVLIGQAAGFGLVAVLAWLQAGADLARIFEHLDGLAWAALVAWPVSHLAVAALDAVHGPDRPLVPVLAALAPLVIGSALAALSTGNLGFMAGLDDPCASFLSVYHGAERLRTLGMLATAACWFGCLPAFIARRGERTPYRPVWLWPTASALFLGACLWTFLDPLLPARSAVGGSAVRGLWVLVGAYPVAGLWAITLGRADEDRAAERGLALWTALFGAWLLTAAGLWILHRTDALLRLSYPPVGAPVVWPDWFEAGLVLGAAVIGLLPLAAFGLFGSLLCSRPSTGGGRRRAIGLAVALAVLGVLALAHETGNREGFAGACLGPGAIDAEPDGPTCPAERRVFGVCLSADRPLVRP